MAWAGPGRSRAVFRAWARPDIFPKPEPPQAGPKPRLLGRAGPEQH